MGHARGRLLVVALTVVALVSLGSTPAIAGSAASSAPSEVRGTTLTGGQPNLLGIHLSLRPQAKLTDAETGAPIAGQTILFYLRGTIIGPHFCAGQTNAAGVARCGGFGVLRDVFWAGGYEAQFQGATVGDIRYDRSVDTVRLLARQ